MSVALWLSPCGCVPFSLSDQHGPRSAGSAAAALGQGSISWTFQFLFHSQNYCKPPSRVGFWGDFFGFSVSVDE